MKSASVAAIVAFGAGVARGQGSFEDWHQPTYGDVRGPCPMLNTLANHAFLPHSGKNITLEKTIHALNTALNLAPDFATYLFNFAVTTNPEANATEFSLENLGRHNVLEHDASLSRADYHFTAPKAATSFNRTVYDQTRSYWTTPRITLQQAADARVARIKTSRASNPEYSLSDLGSGFSVGESVAYVGVLGNSSDRASESVPKEFVEYLFENERLPVCLGWKRSDASFTKTSLFDGMKRIQELQPPLDEAPRMVLRSREFVA